MPTGKWRLQNSIYTIAQWLHQFKNPHQIMSVLAYHLAKMKSNYLEYEPSLALTNDVFVFPINCYLLSCERSALPPISSLQYFKILFLAKFSYSPTLKALSLLLCLTSSWEPPYLDSCFFKSVFSAMNLLPSTIYSAIFIGEVPTVPFTMEKSRDRLPS